MSSGFVSGPVTVEVPASSANLGPGFDSFGLALDLTDTVTASVASSGLALTISGEGSEDLDRSDAHLVVRSMHAAFDRLGPRPDGLVLGCVNRIPHGRGLGSSAAAIVAGIELARGLAVDGRQRLSTTDALALASELEGHPDNVAACLLGGFTVAWTEAGCGRAVRLDPVDVQPVVFVPRDRSLTEAARAALPTSVPHADAAFNVSRSALLTVALTGRPDLLLSATEDRLHQPQRADSMPASSALVSTLRGSGIAAVVSGAGSSVLALARDPDEVQRALALCPVGFEPAQLAVSAGARAR